MTEEGRSAALIESLEQPCGQGCTTYTESFADVEPLSEAATAIVDELVCEVNDDCEVSFLQDAKRIAATASVSKGKETVFLILVIMGFLFFIVNEISFYSPFLK